MVAGNDRGESGSGAAKREQLVRSDVFWSAGLLPYGRIDDD